MKTTMMALTDMTKALRADLQKLGIKARDVSVRAGGSSIRVAVKNLAVSLEAVKTAAHAYEDGNTYVFVDYAWEVLKAGTVELLPLLPEGHSGFVPVGSWLVVCDSEGRYRAWLGESDLQEAVCWDRLACAHYILRHGGLQAKPVVYAAL